MLKCQIKGCENKPIFVIYSHNEDHHEKEICRDCAVKYFNSTFDIEKEREK